MKNRRIERPEPGIPDMEWTLPEPVTVGNGRTKVHLQLVAQGRDFLVLITGGQAHVGAIAVCNGRSERDHVRDNGGMVQVPRHREGPLAAEAAEILALASGRICAAAVGIHQDQATPEEIHEIVVHVRQGLDQLAADFNLGKKS
jgi:hypothetical protein